MCSPTAGSRCTPWAVQGLGMRARLSAGWHHMADNSRVDSPVTAVAGELPVPRISFTATSLTRWVIRELTRLAQEHDAINLAQVFPDFPAPEPVKRAAVAAIETDLNQYPITWGQPSIRQALADSYLRWYGITVDPEREVCVTCGAT